MMNIKLITIKKLHQLMKSKKFYSINCTHYEIEFIQFLDQRSRDSYNWTHAVDIASIIVIVKVTLTINDPYISRRKSRPRPV